MKWKRNGDEKDSDEGDYIEEVGERDAARYYKNKNDRESKSLLVWSQRDEK